jgi:hypothetical protein
MKYFISVILLSCLLAVSYAQSTPNKIRLLDKPSINGKVVNVVSPWQRLIPFYREHGWLKVGDPATGKTGWIDIKKYYDMIFNVPHRPTLQSVFVTINEKPNKNGKYEIIVYKDGKKLKGKEAAKVIKEITAQQERMQRRFRMMQQQMNRLFDQSMKDFDSFGTMVPWSPMIIFVRPKQ